MPTRPSARDARIARATQEHRLTQMMQLVEGVADDLAQYKEQQAERTKVLDARHAHVSQTIENVDKGVQEVLLAMVGNEKFQQKGIVHAVSELQSEVGGMKGDIIDLQSTKKLVLAYASLAGIVVGVLWDLLKEKINPFA